MAFSVVHNIRICGISACVPKNTEENVDLPFYKDKKEALDVIDAIGIERRHVVPLNNRITAADLCYESAVKLMKELNWDKDSIDLLSFTTQNPDYLNHPNSFVIHDKLKLSEHTMCIDFYHGCPGWVVSMSAVCAMLCNGIIKRALLLDGDTVSRDIDTSNREEKPLFGDAGTAIALEYNPDAKPIYFNIGTQSDGGMALAHLNGGFRNPFTLETLTNDLKRRSGLLNIEENVSKMDSMDVFSFAITKVPKALKALCKEFSIEMEEIDNLVLHQANKLIINNIAKRVKVPLDKVPMSLLDYGNTTSASIPLTLVSEKSYFLRHSQQKNMVCGFGTGLSWAAAYFETDKIVCPEIIEI